MDLGLRSPGAPLACDDILAQCGAADAAAATTAAAAAAAAATAATAAAAAAAAAAGKSGDCYEPFCGRRDAELRDAFLHGGQ